MDTSAYSGEYELGHRDEDATDALVADTKDLLAVYLGLEKFNSGVGGRSPLASHDNVVNVLGTTALPEIVLDTVDVINVEEAALWSPEQPRVVLNGLALRRRVDHTENLGQMVEQ
jgi:hypothetical protein